MTKDTPSTGDKNGADEAIPYVRCHNLTWITDLIKQGLTEDSSVATEETAAAAADVDSRAENDPATTIKEKDFVVFDRGDEIALRGVCPRCHHQLDDIVLFEEEVDQPKIHKRLDTALEETFHDRPLENAKRANEARTRREEKELNLEKAKVENRRKRLAFLASQPAKLVSGNDVQATENTTKTVLACNCESEHAGRPEGKLGCGRYAGLLIRVERGNTKQEMPPTPEVTLSPRSVTAADKRWDELSDETPYATLASARGLAEKWTATVATLLSLLGIATFLGAKDQLLKLETDFAIVAGGFAFVSLLAAVVATTSAARAAQGGLRKTREVTGEVIRRVHREAVETIANLLWLSRWSTIVSILTAAVALAIALGGDEIPAASTENASAPTEEGSAPTEEGSVTDE